MMKGTTLTNTIILMDIIGVSEHIVLIKFVLPIYRLLCPTKNY